MRVVCRTDMEKQGGTVNNAITCIGNNILFECR